MRARPLQQGDEIRVISPSKSMSLVADDQKELAKRRLEELGFVVTFSRNCSESDEFGSSSVASRIADLHEAFLDPNVAGILTTLGGFNCNQLLSRIDYSIIAANPKRLCGFSDITALNNAIYAKTGLISYSGPHFSTFGMLHGNEYTMDYFHQMMVRGEKTYLLPSEAWSDDLWFLDQHNRTFMQNEGPYVINEGEAAGVILGGNLCTWRVLHGTAYMPNLHNSILFLEDDEDVTPPVFDRELQSVIHQPGFEGVRGIVIGRFQQASRMTRDLLVKIVKSKQELNGIPVVADLDFGHTTPRFTFPVGGQATVQAYGNTVKVTLREG